MTDLLKTLVAASFFLTASPGVAESGLTDSQKPASETPPGAWIDPATGHRVIRLSDEPGSASLYFHQNMYTATGDKMVFSTPTGLAVIDLKTLKIDPLVAGKAGKVVVGKKTRRVFYMIDDTNEGADRSPLMS